MPNPFEDHNFDSFVLARVRQAVEVCNGELERLFDLVPGLFPSHLTDSLKLLASQDCDQIEKVLKQGSPIIPRSVRNRVLPHPLDFEWLFTQESAKNLADEIGKLGSVLCVGTPSIFINLLAKQSHSTHLVDRELVVEEFKCLYGDSVPASTLGMMRVANPMEYDAAVIDGPWYPEETEIFALTAARHLRVGGVLWVVGPSILTRPGVESERKNLIHRLEAYGLKLREIMVSAVRYETPPFEVATLNVLGLYGVPHQWRRADILCFVSATADPRKITAPEHIQSEMWDEVSIGSARVKFQRARPRPLDFELKSVTPDDVLCSVSRRDPVRKLVSVWTSGNRCFDCGDPHVLFTGLRASRKGMNLFQEIQEQHRLTLSRELYSRLEKTVQRITELLTTEAQEVEWI